MVVLLLGNHGIIGSGNTEFKGSFEVIYLWISHWVGLPKEKKEVIPIGSLNHVYVISCKDLDFSLEKTQTFQHILTGFHQNLKVAGKANLLIL